MDDRVKGLVYIAAVAHDTGETVQSQLDKYPTEIFSHIAVADRRVWLLPPEGTKCFAGDLPEEVLAHTASISDRFSSSSPNDRWLAATHLATAIGKS